MLAAYIAEQPPHVQTIVLIVIGAIIAIVASFFGAYTFLKKGFSDPMSALNYEVKSLNASVERLDKLYEKQEPLVQHINNHEHRICELEKDVAAIAHDNREAHKKFYASIQDLEIIKTKMP